MSRFLPKFTNDLWDIGSDLLASLRYWFHLWAHPKEAPPSIRTPDLAFIPLYAIGTDGKKGESIGCFVPELYELALAEGLRCQRKETSSAMPLLIEAEISGRKKTAFELAVIPVIYSDDDKTSTKKLQKIVEDEYHSRICANLPLPAVSYKYQIVSDYLKGIEKAGLKTGSPRAIKLNMLNPAGKTKSFERGMHYAAQRLAFVLTLGAALLILPKVQFIGLSLGLTATITIGAFLGVVIAEWCGKDFNTYSLAENLLREIDGYKLKSPEKGISAKKLLKTTLLLTALAGAALSGGFFAFKGFMALSFAVKSTALAKVLLGLQYSIAGILAGTAALSTLVGGYVAQSFYWGIGIRDRQIDFSKEPKLVPIKERQALSLSQLQDKIGSLLEKIVITEQSASANESVSSAREFLKVYQKKLKEMPPAANPSTPPAEKATLTLHT